MSLDDALLYCNFKGRSTGSSAPELISPWKNPPEWIDAHLTHLKKIVQDLEKAIGPDNLDTHMFDKDHLIYPRTFLYLFVHSFHCTRDDRRIVELFEIYEKWKASDNISLMVNQSTIKNFLTKRLGQLTEHLDASVIRRLLSLDTIHMSAQLALMVQDKSTIRAMVSKRDEDAQCLINLLQSRLDFDVETDYRPRHVKALDELCRRAGLYPQGLILDDEFSDLGYPVSRGGFGLVHQTTLRSHKVAVKLLTGFSDGQKELRNFASEAVTWLHMDHQRILPFYGLYSGGRGVGFVSPWMEQGHLMAFLKNHPDTNCLYLAEDIIDGIEYLHGTMRIVHGDLKGSNILVTEGGHACLADFGSSRMINNGTVAFTGSQSTDPKLAGTLAWMAPELHCGEQVTFESDIYAFACVCYEMLSGHAPFHHLDKHLLHSIGSKVKEGKRPTMPQDEASVIRGLTTDWWMLITDCWVTNPSGRPNASAVLDRLRLLPGRKDDTRTLGDVDDLTKVKRELRRKEGNPFATLLPEDEDHLSPGLFELKNALALR